MDAIIRPADAYIAVRIAKRAREDRYHSDRELVSQLRSQFRGMLIHKAAETYPGMVLGINELKEKGIIKVLGADKVINRVVAKVYDTMPYAMDEGPYVRFELGKWPTPQAAAAATAAVRKQLWRDMTRASHHRMLLRDGVDHQFVKTMEAEDLTLLGELSREIFWHCEREQLQQHYRHGPI